MKNLLCKFYVLILKVTARLIVPKNKYASVFEVEAKRAQGKLGGGESISLEVTSVVSKLKLLKIKEVIFFDIGANRGKYLEEFLRQWKSTVAVAFEPSKQAFSMLENRFTNQDNIQLVNCALSDFTGESVLFANQSGSGLGSLSSRDLQHLGIDFHHSESIQVTTAAEWIAKTNKIPNFVKIDVEGHELSTLKGFGEFLTDIILLQFEFGGCNIDTRTYFKDFWNLLSPNFDIYRITPHGSDLISSYEENHESFLTTNFIAVNKSTKNS